MSKARDDIHRILKSMNEELETDVKAGVSTAKVTPSIPALPKSLPWDWVPWHYVVAISALVSLVGVALSFYILTGLGAVGSLVGAVYLWVQGQSQAPQGAVKSDMAVEVIKRRALELERDRLLDELRQAHGTIQEMDEKNIRLDQELLKERSGRADTSAKLKQELVDEFEREKRGLLETEKHRVESLKQELAESGRVLNQVLGREEHLKQELASRETSIQELSEKTARLTQELKTAHGAIHELDAKQLKLQEELIQERSGRSELLDQMKKNLLDEFEKEKKGVLDSEKRKLDVFRLGAAESVQALEQSMAREDKLKQQLADREAKLNDTRARLEKLQKDMEAHMVSTSAELADRVSALQKRAEEERKVLQGQLREQEISFQRTLAEAQAGHDHQRAELERKMAELQQKSLKLEQAMEQKASFTSADLGSRMEKMRTEYEQKVRSLESKIEEQESRHQRELGEREMEFNSKKAELIAACESYLKELEAEELRLNQRKESKIG